MKIKINFQMNLFNKKCNNNYNKIFKLQINNKTINNFNFLQFIIILNLMTSQIYYKIIKIN